MKRTKTIAGFTLMELVIAMAVASILMAGVAGFLQSTTEVYVTQDTTVNMQQEVRAAVQFMEREIRMAGYDPTGDADAGVVTAEADHITFTQDILGGCCDGADNDEDDVVDEADEAGTGDGDVLDTEEQITYALDASGNLTRTALGINSDNPVTIARNIDALDFTYLDEDGNTAITPGDIRTIQITVVARSGQALPGFFIRYTDNNTYTNQQGEDIMGGPPGDEFRRILLYGTAKLRNAN